MLYPASVTRLIERLARLPGIGPKTAQRLALYLVTAPEEVARDLAEALTEARRRAGYCAVCANLAEGELCAICRDETRNRRVVCVVEDPRDVVALEKAGVYRGVYHVLHGALSPVDGVGPEKLTIDRLLARVREGVDEVILATNADLEGEATALYLARLLQPLPVRVTCLAYGIPVGADLEYADGKTLSRALEGRREIGK
ncbi:MAG: recombination mediator RecR [Bacillota bacterium]